MTWAIAENNRLKRNDDHQSLSLWNLIFALIKTCLAWLANCICVFFPKLWPMMHSWNVPLHYSLVCLRLRDIQMKTNMVGNDDRNIIKWKCEKSPIIVHSNGGILCGSCQPLGFRYLKTIQLKSPLIRQVDWFLLFDKAKDKVPFKKQTA